MAFAQLMFFCNAKAQIRTNYGKTLRVGRKDAKGEG
jgi:hypothetical protein